MLPRTPAPLTLALLASLLGASASRAQWLPNGIAVAPSDSAQMEVALLPDGTGGVFVGFQRNEGASFRSVLVQRLTSAGAVASGWPASGRVATPMIDFSGASSGLVGTGTELVPDAAGGVYATCPVAAPVGPIVNNSISGWGLVGRVAGNGTVPAGWPAIAMHNPNFNVGVSGPLMIAPDGAGGLVAITSYSQFIQNVEVTGVDWHELAPDGSEPVNDLFDPGIWLYQGWATSPTTLVPDGAGGVTALWVSRTTPYAPGDVTGENLQAARYAHGGSLPWGTGAFTLVDAPGDLVGAVVIPDGSGGGIVAWSEARTAGMGSDIFALRLTSTGAVAPGWGASGNLVCSAADDQLDPALAGDGAGGAWIVWRDHRSGSQWDLYVQHLLGSGARAAGFGASGAALCTAAGDQLEPGCAPDGSGGVVAAWQDFRNGGADIYALRLASSGGVAFGWTPNGNPVCTTAGVQQTPCVAVTALRQEVVAWLDARSGTPQVYAQFMQPDGPVPVQSALVSSEASADGVRVTWWLSAQAGSPVAVERSPGDGGWTVVGQESVDGEGDVSFADRDVSSGERLGYRLRFASDGAQAFSPEAWVTVPGAGFAIRAVTPNPAGPAAIVALSLPRAGEVELSLLDVSGRVAAREARELAAGDQQAPLPGGARLPPGLYVLRARWGGFSLARRVAIVR